MKMVKSLVLGSAAALVAMTGAQAADLPVKAKAVEYVRICSLYGAGFFYIPGTDTCIKLGGYLRADLILGGNSDYAPNLSGQGAANNRLSNYYTSRSRFDLQRRYAHRDRVRRGPHVRGNGLHLDGWWLCRYRYRWYDLLRSSGRRGRRWLYWRR